MNGRESLNLRGHGRKDDTGGGYGERVLERRRIRGHCRSTGPRGTPPQGGGEMTVAPMSVCICIGIASAREEVLPILNNQLAKVSPSLFGLATCEKISSFCM